MNKAIHMSAKNEWKKLFGCLVCIALWLLVFVVV